MLCQCPKLTPLQSRFVASFAALVVLGLIYWSLSNPHFAYAAELDVDGSGQMRIAGEDHNWHRIEEERLAEDGVVDLDDSGRLQDDRLGSARKDVKKAWQARATGQNTPINENDSPNNVDISPGKTAYFTYPKSTLQMPLANDGEGLPSEISGRRSVHVEQKHVELRRRDADEAGYVSDEGELPEAAEKRQTSGSKPVYISVNTCQQPNWKGTGVQNVAPPQLTMYVSMSNQEPGPGSGDAYSFVEGFASVNVTANDDIYISVVAPELTSDFEGSWTYELAVSLNTYYHSVGLDEEFLFLVDTDTDGALLVTDNLTQSSPDDSVYQKWLSFTPPPFTIFVSQRNITGYMGVQNSFCGLQIAANIQGNPEQPMSKDNPVQMGMITRGLGNKPKEQFYVTNLNASTDYWGWVAMNGNGTASGPGIVGGGGKVWSPVPWTTKRDGNCQLLFNLTFCDEVAYAAPSNPNNFPGPNISAIASLYDDYAANMYKNFNYSLQQIACDTTPDAQYSLAKNCTDCAKAYKEWLCAVTIPRCEDFSRNETWLQPRNMGQPFISNNSLLPSEILNASYVPMQDAPKLPGSPAWSQTYWSSWATNSSRNKQIIDEQIMPGPYREVKPCEDLCYSLVQSCPASLGFGCPLRGRGLEVGYGQRSTNGSVTCSYLGAVYSFNGAESLTAGLWKTLFVAAAVWFVLVV